MKCSACNGTGRRLYAREVEDGCDECEATGEVTQVEDDQETYMEFEDFEEFFEAYVECALWSTTDNSDDNGGQPFDENYGPEDLSDETRAQMRKDCLSFLQDNAEDIPPERYKQAGHDFWLTREGHGSGYWDGDWDDEVGRRLTKASKAYGSFELMLGEDGKIHGG